MLWQTWPFDYQGGLTLLGVTTPFITPVMSIDWICSFWRVGFDMLKICMMFGKLIVSLSSLRQFDRTYLGWFAWDSIEGLFQRQASRQSVGSISFLLSIMFQIYLSNCSESRMYDMTCFLLCSFFLVLAW